MVLLMAQRYSRVFWFLMSDWHVIFEKSFLEMRKHIIVVLLSFFNKNSLLGRLLLNTTLPKVTGRDGKESTLSYPNSELHLEFSNLNSLKKEKGLEYFLS